MRTSPNYLHTIVTVMPTGKPDASETDVPPNKMTIHNNRYVTIGRTLSPEVMRVAVMPSVDFAGANGVCIDAL